MQDTVIELMERVRTERLHREYVAMVKTRLDYLKEALHKYHHDQYLLTQKRVTYAGFADCALIPGIRAILEDASDGVTKESIMARLADVLPTLTAEWMDKRKTEFEKIARDGFGTSEAARVPEPLDLALTWFKCLICTAGNNLRYPEILDHSCLRTVECGGDRYMAVVQSKLHWQTPRTDQRYRMHAERVTLDTRLKLMREVIQTFGCNPDTATCAELDACEVRIRCRICSTLGEQHIYNWQTAVSGFVRVTHWLSSALTRVVSIGKAYLPPPGQVHSGRNPSIWLLGACARGPRCEGAGTREGEAGQPCTNHRQRARATGSYLYMVRLPPSGHGRQESSEERVRISTSAS